ncbi:MAG: addiction module antidote protein, HigA family [Bacteroidales bacterium]|nr:addiction module antidote protein, HigA family [Bacteroidales bacterium]
MVEIEGVDLQMILSNLKPKYVTHPGEIIMDEIEYMQISQKEFALLTEAATGIPADLLLRMQTRYDRIKAENKPDFMEKLKKIRKFAAAL